MIKGIVRRLDRLGRATLPVSMRRTVGMVVGEKVDIQIEGNKILVKIFTADENVKGEVREVDCLGRITIPSEYRKTLNLNIEEPVDMYLDNKAICIKKVSLQCVCCGNSDESKLVELNGVHMCTKCIREAWEKVIK